MGKAGPPNRTGIAWKTGSPEERERMCKYQRDYKERKGDFYKKCQKTYELRVKYNLSYEDYEELLLKQDGRCAICDRIKKLHVDHNHETGTVRGLLCNNCNCGIGNLQDDPKIIKKALEYLKCE